MDFPSKKSKYLFEGHTEFGFELYVFFISEISYNHLTSIFGIK